MATQSPGSRETVRNQSNKRSSLGGRFKNWSRHTNREATSRRPPVRSVPPVHELTSYNIGYKPSSEIIRYQRSAPAPTNMSYLPSAQEKLLQNRKFLAKVIGFDAGSFENSSKASKQKAISQLTEDQDGNSRYSNAFSTNRSPRGLRSTSNELEMPHSEVLKGLSLPTTPRLLRGNSKNYGIRRQISSNNQLELSPDFSPEFQARKSAIHFNTPADGLDQSNFQTPAEGESPDQTSKDADKTTAHSRESYHASNYVSPFGDETIDSQKAVVTNRLVERDRPRDARWVYCYKIKRDRLKLSQLLGSNSASDPAVEELLPAF